MNEKIMKQVSENEDSAIRLLNDVKGYKTIIEELEKFIVQQIEEQETLKETKAPTFIFCKLQELKDKYETKY